jgi:hypothetical protein
MAQYELTVCDVDYTGETASAKDQWQAYHLIANSRLIIGVQERDSLADKALSIIVMSLGWDELQKLERLLVKGKVIREEDGVEVAQNLFRDDMPAYSVLIAKVCQANFTDAFSKLPGGKGADAGQQTKASE